MARPGPAGERLVALFLFGVLLFSPPLMLVFDREGTVAGIPLLYLYLFGTWAALIALAAAVVEGARDDGGDRERDRETGG